MIILKHKNYDTDFSIDEILPISSKADLYKAVKLMRVRGCSQMDKRRLCRVVGDVLKNASLLKWILKDLPELERGFVRRLVDAGTGGHIEVPMKKDGTFYDIQNMFMVVTYEDNAAGTWHLIMPDRVRETCSQSMGLDAEGGGSTDVPQVPAYGGEIYVPENIDKAMSGVRVDMMAKLKAEGCPEDVLRQIGGMSNEELLRMMGYSYQKPVFGENATDVKIEFLPAISTFRGLEFPKGEDYAFRVLTDSAVVLCQQVKEGSYVNIYLIRSDTDTIKLAACWGDVINSVYGRDVLKQKVLDLLPKAAKDRFPYLYRILNERTNKDLKGAYLNTIGFNGQPKQWFVMYNVKDKGGHIWSDVLFYGPYHQALEKPTKDVIFMAAKIHDDIKLSGDAKVNDHLVRYMNEGQKSCGSIRNTGSSSFSSIEKYRNTILKHYKRLNLSEEVFAFFSEYSTEKLMEILKVTLPTPVFDETKEKVEILPAVTLHSVVPMKDRKVLADRIVSESLAHMVTKRGKYYYNLYFFKDGKKVRILHCLGDTLNAVFGYDALRGNGNPGVPKLLKKQFPTLYAMLTSKYSLSQGEPYIAALSILGNPKQWYMVIDVADKDEYWNTIRVFGPIREDKTLDHSHKLLKSLDRLTNEIHSSQHHSIMQRWIDLIDPQME